MKALTICQPYAEMIVRGEKTVENRTWPTTYRGELLIHAGKSRDWLEPDDLRKYPHMDFGAAVGVAQLVGCLNSEDAGWWVLKQNPHAHGPWCWVLDDVRRFVTPIPYRGAQGLWQVPADLTRAVFEMALQPKPGLETL